MTVCWYTHGEGWSLLGRLSEEIPNQAVLVRDQGLENKSPKFFPMDNSVAFSTELMFAIGLTPNACNYFKWNWKFKGFPVTTKNSILFILFNKCVITQCHSFLCYLLSSMQPTAELRICRTSFICLLTDTLYLHPNSQLSLANWDFYWGEEAHCSFSLF